MSAANVPSRRRKKRPSGHARRVAKQVKMGIERTPTAAMARLAEANRQIRDKKGPIWEKCQARYQAWLAERSGAAGFMC